MLSTSNVVLAMSGGVAAAAADTKSVLVVDKIAEVDFGGILGTRAGAVAVGMTSDCKVFVYRARRLAVCQRGSQRRQGPAKTRRNDPERRRPRGLSSRPVEAGQRAARRRWPDAVIAQATCDVRHT